MQDEATDESIFLFVNVYQIRFMDPVIAAAI